MLSLGKNKVTVFDCKEFDNIKNTVIATVSSSKKEKDGAYSWNSWNARFVGTAYNKAKSLVEKDRIEIISGSIEHEYDKVKQKDYYNVIIFDFEKIEKQNAE